MKKHNLCWFATTLLFFTLSACTGKHSVNLLVDFSGKEVIQNVQASNGVNISIIKKDTNNALQVACTENNPVSFIIIHDKEKKWNLSKYKFLAVNITNPGSEDLLVECRINADGWLGSGQIIPAGKTRTIRAYIIRDVLPDYLTRKVFGMNALPGGIVKMWSGLDPDSINKFSVVLINPPARATVLVSNIRGEEIMKLPSDDELGKNYFPLVDEFGQLRQKEWPGKMHSLDELLQSKENEAKDNTGNPSQTDWDKYGGWLGGLQLKATGNFRAEKVDGKWWLVDPEGHLFWSHGIGTVRPDESTPISEREHFFSNLPDSNKYRDFYHTETYSPKGYYKGRSIRAFRSFAWNLYKKYGDNWKKEFARLAHVRLKSWAMNTIGGWSSSEIFSMDITPYTETLSSNSRRIEGSEGQWYKFPDPFDKSLSEGLIKEIDRVKKSVNDPFCIGYFVDNELYWGNDFYMAKAVIQSGEDQPAKRAMLEFLKNKYVSIEALNVKWQTTFISWKDFMLNKKLPIAETGDIKAFSKIVANQYFKVIKETLKKTAPQKLYLGCRFDFHYYPNEDTVGAWAVRIAAQYCDVVSFNRYRYSAIDLKPADADKPIIIGEWHMGALDRGMLHFSLRFAENQQNRAELYEFYLKSCLKNPCIVGAHWFEYADEPVLGRFDGENYNTGFVDGCDNPYPEMVKASRNMGKIMYPFRWQK